MKRLHRLLPILLTLALFVGVVSLSMHSASAEPGPQERAIEIAAAHPVIAAALDHFPQWSATAEEDDPDQNTWYVTFYEDQAQESWLGEATVDLDDEQVVDYYVPVFLSPEEEARQRAEVEALVLADPQVLALLGNPDDWQRYTEYDPYEAAWHAVFEWGLDAWDVIVLWDDNDSIWYIEAIRDPYAFDEEQKQRLDRDKALELAFESDALWEVIGDYDDWNAITAPLTEAQWGVSFVVNNQEVYYLRVDIDAWEILEEQAVSAKTGVYLPFHLSGH